VGRGGLDAPRRAIQGWIETYLSPRCPGDVVHLGARMRWQHMQERHCGVMQGRFLKRIAQGLRGCDAEKSVGTSTWVKAMMISPLRYRDDSGLARH
jgi:hypothetical protein